MKYRNIAALFALTVVLSFSSNVLSQEHHYIEGLEHEPGTLSERDIAGVFRVIDALENNYVKGDLEAVMATFADNAVLLEGRGMNMGKKAIRDDHLEWEFENMTFPVFTSKDRVIKGSGNIAYVYEMTTVQSKRNSEEELGRARTSRTIYIVERQPDNSWKIILLKS